MSVCLSVRVEQHVSRWKDSREIWDLGIFRKYIDNIQVSLKSDKNNRYFAWRPKYIFYFISFISS